MAVKRMIVTVDDRERKTLQMDVTVIMKAECPYIVKFYGALFREGEVSQPLRFAKCKPCLDRSVINSVSSS